MGQPTYTVSRSTTIAAPAPRVFELVQDFHEWRQWSPWDDLDPDMEQEYSGADAGVGAVYTWSGNSKAGRGRMEITSVTDARSVEIALDFEKPFKSRNTVVIDLEEKDGGTEVVYRMIGPRTLFVKIMGPFGGMDRMVGKDFERGLERLKAVAEG
jgi:uncharacterized protein YndB with AHSA1/START domain